MPHTVRLQRIRSGSARSWEPGRQLRSQPGSFPQRQADVGIALRFRSLPKAVKGDALSEACYTQVPSIFMTKSTPVSHATHAALELDHEALKDAVRLGHIGELLMAAVEDGHTKNVRLLLPYADPMARVEEALKRAVSHLQLAVIDLLLADRKIRPRVKLNHFLLNAAESGDLELFRRLWNAFPQKETRKMAIRSAARNGHESIVAQVLPHLQMKFQQDCLDGLVDLHHWVGVDLILLYASDHIASPWKTHECPERLPRFMAKVRAQARETHLNQTETRMHPRGQRRLRS